MVDTDYSKVCEKIYGSCYESKHADIFPRHIRMIMAGESGSGKTNLLLNFIMKKLVFYDDIMVYTNSAHQDFYKLLRDYTRLNKDIVTFHSPEDGIADPKDLDKNKTHVIIFDDVMNDNQKVMKDYFCRGRHNNVNVFYLCQSVHQLSKHSIRQNANIFILFEQDDDTLSFFHHANLRANLPLEEFKQICYDAWSKDQGYIVINLWDKAYCGRYLLNYDRMYIPKKYLKNT